MAGEPRCGLTELPVAWCAHCRQPAAEPPPAGDVRFGVPFTAGHDSRCADCGGPIREGDTVAALLDGDGRLLGYGCTDCTGTQQ